MAAIKGEKTKVEVKDFESRVGDLFQDLILKGYVTKDVVLSDKLTITMKALDTKETIDSENLTIAAIDGVPDDVILRIRTLSTLAHAVVSINGEELPDDFTPIKMYDMLSKLPILFIEKLRLAYFDLCEDQRNVFDGDLKEGIENFSIAPGDE